MFFRFSIPSYARKLRSLSPSEKISQASGIVVSDPECCAVGLCSNPGEGMDVCKCRVPSRYRGTLNIACGWWKGKIDRTLLTTPGCFPSKLRWSPSQNILSPVWGSKLRPTTGVQLVLCRDEFRGPRSDYVS
ncbi:hypothetical protein TNCV_3111111 [Trichonephila clavipes]|nr:hypothetical protein TNCV_3111111 [Trichonephila clavipes]